MSQCTCERCERGRQIAALISEGTREDLAAMVRMLWNELAESDEDRCYLRVILDGSWPSAVEQLEAALVQARAYRFAYPEEATQ